PLEASSARSLAREAISARRSAICSSTAWASSPIPLRRLLPRDENSPLAMPFLLLRSPADMRAEQRSTPLAERFFRSDNGCGGKRFRKTLENQAEAVCGKTKGTPVAGT